MLPPVGAMNLTVFFCGLTSNCHAAPRYCAGIGGLPGRTGAEGVFELSLLPASTTPAIASSAYGRFNRRRPVCTAMVPPSFIEGEGGLSTARSLDSTGHAASLAPVSLLSPVCHYNRWF